LSRVWDTGDIYKAKYEGGQRTLYLRMVCTHKLLLQSQGRLGILACLFVNSLIDATDMTEINNKTYTCFFTSSSISLHRKYDDGVIPLATLSASVTVSLWIPYSQCGQRKACLLHSSPFLPSEAIVPGAEPSRVSHCRIDLISHSRDVHMRSSVAGRDRLGCIDTDSAMQADTVWDVRLQE